MSQNHQRHFPVLLAEGALMTGKIKTENKTQ